jgi:tetratricopeptide (TPR) repeat protein
MRTREFLYGAAVVLIGGLSAAARGADKAESPEWWQAEKEVTAALSKPGADIAVLAAAARTAKPATGREAMFNLSLLLRAGMNRDAQAAVKELKRTAPDLESHQVAGIYYLACDRLIAWDVAQTVVEEFAANVREISLGNRLLKHMQEAGRTVEQIDEWLAHKPPGRDNLWVKERLRFNVEHGRGDDLAREMCDQVRKTPDDAQRAIALLDALLYARPWKPGKSPPELAWMSETVKPKLATEAAELARRLKDFDQPAVAVTFYSRAVETPLTDKEIESLGRMSAMWRPPETMRAAFDAHVREGLAACLLKLGRNAEAQKRMVEAADIRKKYALGTNALFAGQVQAASGQRVIEGRIQEQEKPSGNNPAYWRERAAYYRGRNDAAQEEQSLKKGLSLSKPLPAPEGGFRRQGDMRASLVSDYAYFLARQKRADDAVAFLRSEIAEAPADAESAVAAARCLAFDFERHMRADDEVLWKWLTARPKWEHVEERVLERMLEKAKADELDKHFSRAEQLVADKDPSRAFSLGWVMNRMHHAQRSIPLLEQAIRRAENKEFGQRAVFTLFESCLDLNDWKRAETLFPEASMRLTPDEQPEWYSRIAVAAAKAGAKADALRIWKAGAALNPAKMRGLDELAKAGLREELADFYRQMRKRMPTSDVPPNALRTLEAAR